VLEQAETARNPLLERARFLAISGILLDEFYRIRVAALREQIRSGSKARSVDGLKPAKQLKRADKFSNRLIRRQDRCWRDLRSALSTAGIEFVRPEELDACLRQWLARTFDESVRPLLRPVVCNPDRLLEAVGKDELMLFAELDANASAMQIAAVPIPRELPRFLPLPGESHRFVPIEWVTKTFLDLLFPDASITATGVARVLREGSLKRFDNSDDLLALVRDAIERRKHAAVIRLRVEEDMPDHLTRAIADGLGLMHPEQRKALEKSRLRTTASEFVVADDFLGLADLLELVDQLPRTVARGLTFPARRPHAPPFACEFDGDIFRAIDQRERMLHLPYDDFDVLVGLLEHAAADPAVEKIEQTLYRTGHDSPVAEALITAAREGKAVSVVIELEARDDELENVELAQRLASVGVDVRYGFADLKVHAKLLIIDRRIGERTHSYVHCSTGNYEVASGHRYTDIGILSAEPALVADIKQLFAYARDGRVPRNLRRTAIAPLGLRERVLELIENETRNANAGRPAAIWLKLNKLSDLAIIRQLYRAAQAGVDIEIIVRGVCCLIPGVPGLSEMIRVRSVVGRYLEHSRVYCFGNGGRLPSETAIVAISSADLMPHKLDGRVEALVTIEDLELKRRVQHEAMELYLADESNTWTLGPNGRWTRAHKSGFDVQQALSERHA
jgi:polyphosphate kinase